jgi:hypothetical protein
MSELTPYIIKDKDAAGNSLSPLSIKENLFQENWLQELLFKHPSILPLGEIDVGYSPAISIGREIANIDNLFISPNGLITIVETKLWRNPEAHRTVVAQILDYAKTLSTWDYSKLDEAVKTDLGRRLGKPKSIYELVKTKKPSLEMNEIEFKQRVEDGLNDAKFALLVVGDKIYPAATQLAEVIQSAPHLQFTLGFVELRCYKLEKDMDWPLVVIPRIVAKTKETTRAVIKVIYEKKKPEIEVSTIEEEKSRAGYTSPPEFLASLPSDISEIFRLYIERWIKAGYTVYWGKVGFSLRIPWKGKLVTVFDAYPEYASILQEKRVKYNDLTNEEYQSYRNELMECPALAIVFSSGKTYIRYEQISQEELRLLLESTDKVVKAWFERQKNN